MSPRENMLRVLALDHPQYTPTHLPVQGFGYLGGNHEGLDGTGGDNSPAGARWRDIWGVGWHKELEGVMGMPQVHPLADLSRVDDYPCPNSHDPRICARIHQAQLNFDRDQFFLAGWHRDTLFEQAYMLVGMENLFIAFHEQPNAVRRLLHRIIDFHLGIAQQYVSRGIEWAFLGDDLGHQHGLLFSRQILQEFFVPEYRRLFAYYKSHGVRINFHSCGCVQDIVDIFLDLGVDVLNPVQATANDLALLRQRTLGRITLQGAIPSHIVAEGPIDAIRQHVREKIQLLGRTGGYICQPDQVLPFPPAHLQALEQAVGEFGKFPIA